MPSTVVENEINEILVAMLARIRIFANTFSNMAGAHKSIKGHHTFFINRPEFVGGTFDYMMMSEVAPGIYVLISGRETPAQKDIIRRIFWFNAEDYKALFNF